MFKQVELGYIKTSWNWGKIYRKSYNRFPRGPENS